jgi:hypothetical protein
MVAFALLFGLAGGYVLFQDRGRGPAPDSLAAGEAVSCSDAVPSNLCLADRVLIGYL